MKTIKYIKVCHVCYNYVIVTFKVNSRMYPRQIIFLWLDTDECIFLWNGTFLMTVLTQLFEWFNSMNHICRMRVFLFNKRGQPV